MKPHILKAHKNMNVKEFKDVFHGIHFGKVQDNKALHRRYIKWYKQNNQHQNEAISKSTLE